MTFWGNIHIDRIEQLWCETPLEDVVANIHSSSFSEVQGALGKLKCVVHLASLSA